jgi:hypothetical protein
VFDSIDIERLQVLPYKPLETSRSGEMYTYRHKGRRDRGEREMNELLVVLRRCLAFQDSRDLWELHPVVVFWVDIRRRCLVMGVDVEEQPNEGLHLRPSVLLEVLNGFVNGPVDAGRILCVDVLEGNVEEQPILDKKALSNDPHPSQRRIPGRSSHTHLERHIHAPLRLSAHIVQLLVQESVFLGSEANKVLDDNLGRKATDQLALIGFRTGRAPNNGSTHPFLQVAHEVILARFDLYHWIHGTIRHGSRLNGRLQLVEHFMMIFRRC